MIPFCLAHSGNAFRNSRILEDSGWKIPNADNSIKILITCSFSGSLNARYGEHGLMKLFAARRHPRYLLNRKSLRRLLKRKGGRV